jgi:hypothetical protein
MMTNPRTLRAGDTGADVTALQLRLARAGFAVASNGHYDADTGAAVRSYQRSKGMVADGLAGPRTQAALLGVVDPRALTQPNIDAAAAALECEPATINAVIEVESLHGGFLPDGRVAILFERHVFWRELVKQGTDPTSLHAPESICSRQRGGYIGGAGEYPRLTLASSIDVNSAYASCSWGRFQIMGYHAESLGYGSAPSMAAAFTDGEAEHLRAFVALVQLSPDLHKALRTRKWAAFAKLYNGPAYADNLYDAKLARAYARHSAAAVPA